MNEKKTKQDKRETNFVPIREAHIITGLDPQTLRKLADDKKITSYKTPSGQRKFDRESLQKMCNPVATNDQARENPKINFLYARVSSKKQMDDLSRQIKYLKSKRDEYSSYISISDIGSGINFKRQGLSTILDSCLQGSIGEIVIAHKDRLSRFGFDLIQLIVKKSGGQIIIVDDEKHKSSEQELSEDLLSIVHIYSCRQMGRRRYKNNEITKDKVKSNKDTT